MSRVIDFERYRRSKEITCIDDDTGDHHDGYDYPLDGIFYADDDYDTPVEDDSLWDLEP